MDIYVGHSSSIDYEDRLYQPLRNSRLDEEHNIVLPHEDSDEPFESKKFLREDCDLFIAEVSKPSTGLGIELGWADIYDVPIVCVHREDADISSSLSVVSDEIIGYEDTEELVELIGKVVE